MRTPACHALLDEMIITAYINALTDSTQKGKGKALATGNASRDFTCHVNACGGRAPLNRGEANVF